MMVKAAYHLQAAVLEKMPIYFMTPLMHAMEAVRTAKLLIH